MRTQCEKQQGYPKYTVARITKKSSNNMRSYYQSKVYLTVLKGLNQQQSGMNAITGVSY